MFINKLLYKYSLHKQDRKTTAFPDFTHCTHILLLLEGDAWLSVEKAVSDLRNTGKNVTIICYMPHAKPEQQTDTPFCIVTKKDFSLWGKPKKILLQLLAQHYDLLLDLTNGQDLHTLWMSALATADFKAGQTSQAPFYVADRRLDFIIQIPSSAPADYLLGQILFYLKQIKPQS